MSHMPIVPGSDIWGVGWKVGWSLWCGRVRGKPKISLIVYFMFILIFMRFPTISKKYPAADAIIFVGGGGKYNIKIHKIANFVFILLFM